MRKLLLFVSLTHSILSSCNDNEIRTYKVAIDSTADVSVVPISGDSATFPE